MKTGNLFLVFCVVFFAGRPGPAAGSAVSVTVYNNDLALVRETRSVSLEKGIQTYRFRDVAAKIDPASVLFRPLSTNAKITLLEQNFEYDLVETGRLLEKYRDEPILVSTRDGAVFSGTLLNACGGDVIVRTQEGPVRAVKARAVDSVEFPYLPGGLVTRPTLVWLLRSEQAGNYASEISYLTGGIQWQAEYVAAVNAENTWIDLGGWVSIDNRSGASYASAKLTLVAGDVHMAGPVPFPQPALSARQDRGTTAAPRFREKAFFEYHLYTLQRQATLKDRQIKQISFFSPVRTAVKKVYLFDGRNDNRKVNTLLTFKNEKSSGLGMPLPKGKVRLYQQDDDGGQVFIGEDRIDHTPENGTVRIFTGNAFDVTGKRTVRSLQKVGKHGRKETIEILVENAKDQNISVTVREHFRGDWEFMGTIPKILKKDAFGAEFEILVAKKSEKSFRYTVLYR